MAVTAGQKASLKQYVNGDLKDEKGLPMKGVREHSSKQRKSMCKGPERACYVWNWNEKTSVAGA